MADIRFWFQLPIRFYLFCRVWNSRLKCVLIYYRTLIVARKTGCIQLELSSCSRMEMSRLIIQGKTCRLFMRLIPRYCWVICLDGIPRMFAGVMELHNTWSDWYLSQTSSQNCIGTYNLNLVPLRWPWLGILLCQNIFWGYITTRQQQETWPRFEMLRCRHIFWGYVSSLKFLLQDNCSRFKSAKILVGVIWCAPEKRLHKPVPLPDYSDRSCERLAND